MIEFCSRCFVPNTRPRITFENINGKLVCSACIHANSKKEIDWDERQKFFETLCDKYRGNGTDPDCIVPWGGGKDSIYVAYKMREFGMTPLLVCVIPHFETEIGKWNRLNMCPDFQKLYVTLKENKYRALAKKYFIEKGLPKHPMEVAHSAIPIKQAIELNIPFVIYGEEGEQEYGGTSRERDRWNKPVGLEYLKELYWQGNQGGENVWGTPSFEKFKNLYFTQYSRFENWQPFKHADFAVVKGMRTEPVRSTGTFTVSAQIGDSLQDFHAYMMFVKFGFGRCTSDVAIAIRDGWCGQEEGLEWIEAYDGEFPNKLLPDLLKYFDMTYDAFSDTIANFADKNILDRISTPNATHIWHLKEWVARQRRRNTPQELVNNNRFNFTRK